MRIFIQVTSEDGMRNEILEYFRKANGEFVSGEQISQDLNVSRTAIWKQINVLKSRGYILNPAQEKDTG